MDHPGCPFRAAGDDVLANEHAVVRGDINPVTPGHRLIVTRRHVADDFDTTPDGQIAQRLLVCRAKIRLQREYRRGGFNVGVSVGEVAGQTVSHVPNLIPRYRGDTPQPSGGARGVIPDKQSY